MKIIFKCHYDFYKNFLIQKYQKGIKVKYFLKKNYTVIPKNNIFLKK